MLPTSIAIALMVVGMGGVTLWLFAWAFWSGQFDELDRQARLVFEEGDLQVAREWENEAQSLARRARYGRLIPPSPGEWGGAR